MKFKNTKNHGINYKGVYIPARSEREVPDECNTDVTEKNDDYEQELIDIKGIGKKVVQEILSFAPTKKQLLKIPEEELYARLRDDIAEKIIDYRGE